MNLSLQTLVAPLRALPPPHGGAPVIVGISGFGGSGKSTLARELAEQLGEGEIVSLVSFWVPERDVHSADWDAYDRERLIERVLRPAKRGEAIRYQRHDWQTGALGEWRTVPSTRFLIIEGI